MGRKRVLLCASWAALIGAGLFFGCAVYLVLTISPRETAVEPTAADQPLPAPAAQPAWDRFAGLTSGRIFFGDAKPVKVEPKQEYNSSLTVRGIVTGGSGPPRAILARVGALITDSTWIVMPGMTINGETVTAIGHDRVTLSKDGMAAVLVLSGP